MTTTIQISENLRDTLLEFKKNSKTSYEEVITLLLNNYKKNQIHKEKLLIQGYIEMDNLTKQMNSNWDKLDIEGMKNF